VAVELRVYRDAVGKRRSRFIQGRRLDGNWTEHNENI